MVECLGDRRRDDRTPQGGGCRPTRGHRPSRGRAADCRDPAAGLRTAHADPQGRQEDGERRPLPGPCLVESLDDEKSPGIAPNPALVPLGLGVLADALAVPNPEQARGPLDEAFARLRKVAVDGSPGQGQDSVASRMAELLPVVERINPDRLAERIWPRPLARLRRRSRRTMRFRGRLFWRCSSPATTGSSPTRSPRLISKG